MREEGRNGTVRFGLFGGVGGEISGFAFERHCYGFVQSSRVFLVNVEVDGEVLICCKNMKPLDRDKTRQVVT